MRTGETLALLGNSGNSDAPHLHMHLVDAPSPLAAEGIPYELREFEVLGSVTSLRAVAEGEGWHVTHPPELRRHELPTENVIVTFHSIRLLHHHFVNGEEKQRRLSEK